MITVTYDAYTGTPVSDGRADELASSLIAAHDRGGNPSIVVSTENIVNALRIAVVQKRIHADDIELLFEGQRLRIYPSGGIAPRPEGFCDYNVNSMLELM